MGELSQGFLMSRPKQSLELSLNNSMKNLSVFQKSLVLAVMELV